MISNDRLQKALTYLAETDEPAAKAKALLVGLDETTKTVRAQVFLKSSGTNGEREACAYDSKDYREHVKKVENATMDYELYRNKRLTESLIVEVWRTVSANQRKGNI